MSDFNNTNQPVNAGSTADDFNPVFGGLDVSEVPGTNLSLKQLFTPMAVALKNGSVSSLAKANAIRRLASLGLQSDNVTQNFDMIMSSLVGDIGQHEALHPEQANRRLGQHMSDSYQLSLTSIRAARAIASGGEIDQSWIEDQKKLGYAVPDDLSSLPLPKLFQKSISDMFEGLQSWQRAVANAGRDIGKMTLLNDGTQEITNPVTDAAESFIKEQAKRFSPLMNAFDVPEIIKQTEIAVGQQGAALTQPEFIIPTAAGMAAGLIPEVRLGRAFAAGALSGQTITNGESEAGSMYLSLAADETMQEVPDKIKRAYALAYGAIAAGIETIPQAMLPGIKELLSRNLKANLVTGQAKEFLTDQIKKNFGKNLAKATMAEAITEPMQQIIQNTMQNAVADETLTGGLYGMLTNQDLVFSDAEKERMVREGTIPGHTDIWEGVMSSMLSGAMSSLGLGLITGGVGSVLGGFRKNGAKNVPQAVAEKPVEPIESVLDEGFIDSSVPVGEDSIPEVFHADIGLTTDFDKTGSSMVISTDPSAVSGPSSTTAITPVTRTDIEAALSKHYTESVLADFTAAIDNPDHQISQETMDYEIKTGFDFDTIKKDIIPNIGNPSINSDFKEALFEIGVTPKANTKLTSIVLDKSSTKVVNSAPTDVVISSAKSEGFGAIAWKSGNFWNAVVVDPKSVHKVSDSAITKQDIKSTEDTVKTSSKSVRSIEKDISDSQLVVEDINSKLLSENDESIISGLNNDLKFVTTNIESLKSELETAKKNNSSKKRTSSTKKSISESQTNITEKLQTELSQSTLSKADPSIFKNGYDAIFSQLKKAGVNDNYSNVVATVISTLTERSGFSAKRIADTVRVGIGDDGVNHGLYARFPASILSAKVDSDPEVLIHEYTHAYLDFAPKSIIQKISTIYGKPVSEWTDAEHERFVDDHLLYHKSEKKSDFLSKYDQNDRMTIVAVFEQLKQYIVKTIRRIGRFGKNLGPNVIDFYDKLYDGEFYDTTEDFTANDKSFEEVSEGVYVSKSTGEVITFSDKNVLKAVRVFPMAEERTLESVKEDIKNGYEVPLSVLRNYIDDPDVATEYNFILTTEGMFFDLETKSDSELERLGYPAGQKERLRNEIGGFGKSSDNVFKKYIKENFTEVMKSIKSKFGEKYIDNVLGMNGRPLDDAAMRYATRHASDFRWAFWQSMKDTDPLYAAAVKNEAQWQEEQAIHRDEMAEDNEASEVAPSGMSLKRLEAMVWKRNSDLAAMEREIKLLKAKGSATVEMQKSLAKKAAKQRRETTSALKAMRAEKIAMVAGLKNASKVSPGKVATDYADSIDMIARMVSDDATIDDNQRNVYDIQKLKSLMSKDNYLASIDIDRLSNLSKLFPDKYTLDDINFLNQTKYTIREAGKIAFDDSVKIRFTDEVQKEIAKYFNQRREQNKKAPIVDVEKYFESKSYKDLFTSMRDVSPELLATVSGSYTTATEMRRSISNKRKAARQFYMDKASDVYPVPKKEKGESKDSFDERKTEASNLRKSFAKREFDQSIYRKLSQDEVSDIANMTMDEFRGKYIVGSKDFEMLTKGTLSANVFNALYRGDTLPERMLQMFDGGDVNGFFYNLIIGRSRGWGTRVGYEQKYRRAMHDIQDQYTEILSRHNKTPESNVDRFVLNKKTGQVTVYTHSIRSKADEIVKDNPSDYTSFDRQEVMEMYAATKSDTKYRAVIYGNEIAPEQLSNMVSMLDDGDIEVSDWILSKYAETVDDLRREFELSTGERFVFSDGDHSPIFRMFGEHDYSDAATQAELGSPTSRIQGTRTLGINTTHLGRNQRNIISKDSQMPIKLALVSNFFNHIDEVLRYTNSANDIRIMKASLGMDGNIKNPIAIQIQSDIGKSNWDFIAERINEMEGNTAIEKRDSGITLWIRKAVNNLPVAQMGFMFINAVLQHLGALSSASKFRNPWFAVPRITAKIGKFYFDRFRMKNNMEFIKNLMQENPYLRDRRVDRSMKDLKTASLEGAEHGLDKLKRLSMWQFILVDEITTAASFEAKFEEEYSYLSKQNEKLYSGQELILKNQESEIVARNKAKETIAKTQPDESIWATPTNYRSNNIIIQLMSPFMSAMSKVANQIVYDLPNTFKATFSGKWSKRLDMKRSALLNVGSSILIFSFLNSMLYFVVKNMRAPNDEEWFKSITDWLVNPLGLPGKIAMSVADLVNGAIGNKVQEGRGDTILQSQGKKIMKAMTEAGSGVRSGDTSDIVSGTIKAAAGIAGFAGVASNAVNHGVDWVRYAAENEDPVMLLMAPLGTTVPR